MATKITIARICLIPFILFFYLMAANVESEFFFRYGKLVALILFMVAVATDYLDGLVARKKDQISVVGKLLDPVADKLLMLAGFVLIITDLPLYGIMAGSNNFDELARVMLPFAAVLILFIPLARDYVISILRMIAAGKGITMAADKLGKAKTIVTGLAISMFMFYAAYYNIDNSALVIGDGATIYRYIMWSVMLVATALTIISGVNYCLGYYREAKKQALELIELEAKEKEGKTKKGETK
jgi:phosphatidylglycerophosphate synthase